MWKVSKKSISLAKTLLRLALKDIPGEQKVRSIKPSGGSRRYSDKKC
jgi:hypothetical protein